MNSKVKPVELIKWIITFLVPIAVSFIPVSEAFTQDLKVFFMITIFVILIIAFEFFDSIIPAIMLPTMYYLSGIVPLNVAFGSWTSSTVWMIMGALLLTAVLEQCGLLNRIAYFCIKACGGTFTGTLYGVLLMGTVISFLTFSNSYVILVTMGVGVCKALKLKPCSKEAALVCMSSMMGAHTVTGFLYNPTFVAFGAAGIEAAMPGKTIEWYDMMLYNGPMVFMCFGIIWLLSVIFKTKNIVLEGDKDYFENEYKALGPMSLGEKKASVILIILMVYLFTSPIHGYDAATGFMTIPYLLFLPGIAVGDVKNASKNINFKVIVFLASCLGIGMVGGALNLSQAVSTLITPMLEGKGTLITLLMMMTCGIFGNLFMTPYAMMSSLSGPFAQVAVDLGLNPIVTVMTLMISTDLVFFPYETTPYVVLYGFGMIAMADYIKLHVMKIIITFIVFAAALVPYWSLLGIL